MDLEAGGTGVLGLEHLAWTLVRDPGLGSGRTGGVETTTVGWKANASPSPRGQGEVVCPPPGVAAERACQGVGSARLAGGRLPQKPMSLDKAPVKVGRGARTYSQGRSIAALYRM